MDRILLTLEYPAMTATVVNLPEPAAVTERLGLEGKGGMARIGAVHYNTVEEIRRLGDA